VKDMLDNLQLRLPAIAISAQDIDRLRHLAEAAMEKHPTTAEFLAREIDRTEIIPADRSVIDDISGLRRKVNLVTMQSEVTFVDDISGEKRKVVLFIRKTPTSMPARSRFSHLSAQPLSACLRDRASSLKPPPADGVR